MRIVLTAPVEEPVPPKAYGGTELVVYNLCQEMVELGHEVFLLAAGDSITNANLLAVTPMSLRTAYELDEIDQWREVIKLHSVATMLRGIRQLKPDLVLNHIGWRFVPFIDLIDCPVFTTVHGAVGQNEQYTYERYPHAQLISISDNQRLALPKGNWIQTVYNGIDLSQFEVGEKEDRLYFTFLGRTSPEKGLKEICTMIKHTKHKLKIAAKVDSTDQAFFEAEIKPLIDGKQIEFLGEVGPKEKKEFLQNAKALLLWLNWEEPFGLVVVEAMASGTPVIVNDRGAMREIVVDGKTGVLVETMDEMEKALDEVNKISSKTCRTHVQKHFSARRMASQYLQLAGKGIE